jgi:hydrogenase nickel incorporation protein HypB
MCTTCGCGHGQTRIDGVATRAPASAAGFRHADAQAASLFAGAAHGHAPGHAHASPLGAVHDAATGADRIVAIEQDILGRNNAVAARNRRYFAQRGILALNLMSSPGSGKTSLLVRTIDALKSHVAIAVVEGDQQTSLDADRIRATGAPAVQVNTGKGCHLDADMVERALATLAPPDACIVLIENVGNLVCPAAFDLGEAHKVVILSVTEGDDKPLKYPDMFHAADLMVINKSDLLPYVDFSVDAAVANARRIRPGLPALTVSARSGEGFADWIAWVVRQRVDAVEARAGTADARRPAAAELASDADTAVSSR